MFRNVFAFEDEEPSWRAVLENFPNHVPRFSSANGVNAKEEAIAFTKEHWNVSSNPDPRYAHLKQAVSTFVEWSQVEKYLLPKIAEYDARFGAGNDEFDERVRAIEREARTHNRYMCSTATDNAVSTTGERKEEREESWEAVATESEEAQARYEASLPLRSQALLRYVQSRLDLGIHRELSAESRINTLKYLFFHMKCGIYVMIRDNAVKVFAPFANKDYRNTWAAHLRFDCTSDEKNPQAYAREKAATLRYPAEQYLPSEQWWANGNIICNMYANESGEVARENDAQIWNDAFLFQLKDMFAELCRTRAVPDCEFFLNKRDYPQLKVNPTRGVVEPYGFIFDRDDRDPEQDVDLTRHKYKSYLPVFSFYLSERFADIPMPPTEDWMAATGEIFPDSFTPRVENGAFKNPEPKDLFTSDNLKKFSRPWEEKKPIAFFRGSATGGGVTCETNQRLRVAEIDEFWGRIDRLNGKDESANQGFPFLDAKIVGWNMRDKKIASSKVTYIRRNGFSFRGGRDLRVPIYEQSAFKYILYIEGHCAACRYAFMMSLESVILRVESTCVADQMWYFPLLRNGYDHILIKSDYSNLLEVLEWCHTHDDECHRIAMNARRLYEQYISRDGILDYLQCVTLEMAKRWRPMSTFLNDPTDPLTHMPKARPPPVLDMQKYLSDEINKSLQGRRDANPLIKPNETVPSLPQGRKRRFRELYHCVDDSRTHTRERCTYCREAIEAEKAAALAPTAAAATTGTAAAQEAPKVRRRGVMRKSVTTEPSANTVAMDPDDE